MLEQITLCAPLIVFMAAAARVAGGGVFKHPAGVGEAMLSLPIAVAIGVNYGSFWAVVACFAWVFMWFQTGHALAFKMGADPATAQSGRKAFLSHIIDPLCKATGKPLGGVFYCWVWMGLKGFLMHLPLGGWAGLMAVLWPLAYWFGNRFIPLVVATVDGEMVAEYLSGAFSGIVLAAYILTQ